MAIVDYVIIGLAAFAAIYGLATGLLKQIKLLVAFVGIPILTGLLAKYPYDWFASMVDPVRFYVATGATYLVLLIVYLPFDMVIKRKEDKKPTFLSRLLGLVFGAAVIYGILSIVLAFIANPGQTFFVKLSDLCQ